MHRYEQEKLTWVATLKQQGRYEEVLQYQSDEQSNYEWMIEAYVEKDKDMGRKKAILDISQLQSYGLITIPKKVAGYLFHEALKTIDQQTIELALTAFWPKYDAIATTGDQVLKDLVQELFTTHTISKHAFDSIKQLAQQDEEICYVLSCIYRLDIQLFDEGYEEALWACKDPKVREEMQYQYVLKQVQAGDKGRKEEAIHFAKTHEDRKEWYRRCAFLYTELFQNLLEDEEKKQGLPLLEKAIELYEQHLALEQSDESSKAAVKQVQYLWSLWR